MGLTKGSLRPFGPIALGAGFFSATTGVSAGFDAVAFTNGTTGLGAAFLTDFVETFLADFVETVFFSAVLAGAGVFDVSTVGAATPVLVVGTTALVDVVTGDFPTAAGLPGADVAPLFVAAVEAVDEFLAAWLPAFELVLAGPLVPGVALGFTGVGVAVALFAAAGWLAGEGLLAPVFCAVAIVAVAAASASI